MVTCWTTAEGLQADAAACLPHLLPLLFAAEGPLLGPCSRRLLEGPGSAFVAPCLVPASKSARAPRFRRFAHSNGVHPWRSTRLQPAKGWAHRKH